jgi:lipopolysaccharide/colanic/teichoic acid biosynthesis glycosyltransferase
VVRKFRTMTDARDVNGVLLPDELRQTALSAFLRRIRLDELPQLLSVLRGELSFVGPRPLPMSIIAALGKAGALRCAIAPGMTGWAQVNGNTLLTMEEKIALDIWYIDRWSLWKDIQIVGMTVRTILFGEKVNRRNVELALTHFHQRTWAPGSVAEDL